MSKECICVPRKNRAKEKYTKRQIGSSEGRRKRGRKQELQGVGQGMKEEGRRKQIMREIDRKTDRQIDILTNR